MWERSGSQVMAKNALNQSDLIILTVNILLMDWDLTLFFFPCT